MCCVCIYCSAAEMGIIPGDTGTGSRAFQQCWAPLCVGESPGTWHREAGPQQVLVLLLLVQRVAKM